MMKHGLFHLVKSDYGAIIPLPVVHLLHIVTFYTVIFTLTEDAFSTQLHNEGRHATEKHYN